MDYQIGVEEFYNDIEYNERQAILAEMAKEVLAA